MTENKKSLRKAQWPHFGKLTSTGSVTAMIPFAPFKKNSRKYTSQKNSTKNTEVVALRTQRKILVKKLTIFGHSVKRIIRIFISKKNSVRSVRQPQCAPWKKNHQNIHFKKKLSALSVTTSVRSVKKNHQNIHFKKTQCAQCDNLSALREKESSVNTSHKKNSLYSVKQKNSAAP
jgi:uncharacterized membrane protein